jgi:hypothetical protein
MPNGHSDLYFQFVTKVKQLMDVTRSVAFKRWTAHDLVAVHKEINRIEKAPKDMEPSDLTTWDHLFFKNNARVYGITKDGVDVEGEVPAIRRKRIERIRDVFAKLGLFEDGESIPGIGPQYDQWFDFLEFVITKLTAIGPAQPKEVSTSALISHGYDTVHTLIHKSLGDEFKGRDKFLPEKILVHFKADLNRTTSVVVILHGLGGIGKTRLAEEYAYKYMHEKYSSVLFIGADTEDDLRRNVLAIVQSQKFDIPSQAKSYEAAIHSLSGWLRKSGSWLVIFDNVDTEEAAHAVKAIVPQLLGGHILITSRLSHWPRGFGHLVLVEQLHLDDAVEFLLAATKKTDADQNERVEARSLARTLGCIPSLLVYAAGTVEYAPYTFSGYEAQWKKSASKLTWHDKNKSKRITGYPSPKEAQTWQTSVENLHDGARKLFYLLGWFGPEPIPRSLLSVELNTALIELEGHSLVTPVRKESGPYEAFTLNSALQDTTRAFLDGTGEVQSLIDAANLIARGYEHDRAGLAPHAVRVLHYLHGDRFKDSDAIDHFDSMGRLSVLALAHSEDKGASSVEYLTTLLSDFYEIEPLVSLLDKLVQKKELWLVLQEQLLKVENYVLRYAMAEAIADNWSVEEVTTALKSARMLNEFELAGYALGLLYARKPEVIDPKCLLLLADRPAYCGRSILGDLFLNLVFLGGAKKKGIGGLEMLANDNFWKSRWDFIQLDVQTIKAAEAFMDLRIGQSKMDERTQETYRLLRVLKSDISKLQKEERFKPLRSIFANYFQLGQKPNYIDDEGRVALDKLDKHDLAIVMRVLFSHPIWSVAESAATVLSGLIVDHKEKRAERLQIIRDLLSDKSNWRAQFGANEAAFAVRHVDPELFEQSVRDNYKHWNCKIRGLCAENLISQMLNSGAETRNKMYKQYKVEIAKWVVDDDCWVLEHVFRLFHTTRDAPITETKQGRKVSVNPNTLAKKSKLLLNVKDWHRLDRETFLSTIEKEKMPKSKK